MWVVMVEDRHTDTEVYLFGTCAEALAFARGMADKAAEHYQARPVEELTDSMKAGGGIFWSSIEDGCTVRVMAREVKS